MHALEQGVKTGMVVQRREQERPGVTNDGRIRVDAAIVRDCVLLRAGMSPLEAVARHQGAGASLATISLPRANRFPSSMNGFSTR